MKGRKRITTPEWALDMKQLQTFLLKRFPDMATDDTQRTRAGRWASVFHLYYVMKYPASAVALELNITRESVQRTLRDMRDYAAGKNGIRRVATRTGWKAVRPKKNFNW